MMPEPGTAPPYPLPPASELWDPRPLSEAADSPLRNACCLPLAELSWRHAELPPRGAQVSVAASGELAEGAFAAMERLGRIPNVAPRECLVATDSFEQKRLWRPNAFLECTLPGLVLTNAALDLGCGSGREALLMASWGWEVTAIDMLPDALEIAKRLEATYAHPNAPHVNWVCADLEKGDVQLGGPFGLITSFRYLNRPLMLRAGDLLDAGGSLMVETFTETHRAHYGKPRREAFVLAAGELPRLAKGLEVVQYAEGWHEGSHTARLWAR